MYDKGEYVLDLKMEDGGKKRFKLRVVIVHDRYPDGTPRHIEVIRMRDKVDVVKHPELMTVWVPAVMLGNEGNG